MAKFTSCVYIWSTLDGSGHETAAVLLPGFAINCDLTQMPFSRHVTSRWGLNIPEELGRHHCSWCLGSFCCQDISIYAILRQYRKGRHLTSMGKDFNQLRYHNEFRWISVISNTGTRELNFSEIPSQGIITFTLNNVHVELTFPKQSQNMHPYKEFYIIFPKRLPQPNQKHSTLTHTYPTGVFQSQNEPTVVGRIQSFVMAA